MIETLNPVYGGKPDGEVHINKMLEEKIVKGIKKYLSKQTDNKNIDRLNYYFTEDLGNDIKWLGNVTLKNALKTIKNRAKRDGKSYELNATYVTNKGELISLLEETEDLSSSQSYWIGDFNSEKCMAGDELTNIFYKRLVYKVTAR